MNRRTMGRVAALAAVILASACGANHAGMPPTTLPAMEQPV